MLGSINLAEFVTEDRRFNEKDFINTVQIAVCALNEVLDEGLSLHPLEEQRKSVSDWRQIGLGIFGLGDMLIKMGIRYGSKKSIELCDKIGYLMMNSALDMSLEISKFFGEYPKCHKEQILNSLLLRQHSDPKMRAEISKYGLRNSQLLTSAPTGTTSTMLGVSGGIEPIYANSYERKTESLHGTDKYYKVYTPIVEQYMKEHNLKDESELPDYFVTAQDLDYKERIDMQSIWQTHIDASISSTVNVPNYFTIEDVEQLYLYAWEKGLKGVTIYRDGCKRSGILSTSDSKGEGESESNNQTEGLPRGVIIKADDNCVGRKRTLMTGCGTLHCEAFFDPFTGELLETYFSKGSSGGCNNFMISLSRMISLSARAGVDIHSIVDQLQSSGTCPSYAVRSATKRDTSKGSCCPVAIGNALLDMYKEIQAEINDEEEVKESPIKEISCKVINPCPTCGMELVFEGGCNTCKNCGYSKCD